MKHFFKNKELWKENLSIAMKGKSRPQTEETKQKIRIAMLGDKNPAKRFEVRQKISLSKKGNKCHLWKGGISFEKYSLQFNNFIRRKIRYRDNYQCQICGKKQEKRLLDIHHIDYDKKNSEERNLITLCRSCHIKTNQNRNYWINYFKSKLGINWE